VFQQPFGHRCLFYEKEIDCFSEKGNTYKEKTYDEPSMSIHPYQKKDWVKEKKILRRRFGTEIYKKCEREE
jgi:hypothetical protein